MWIFFLPSVSFFHSTRWFMTDLWLTNFSDILRKLLSKGLDCTSQTTLFLRDNLLMKVNKVLVLIFISSKHSPPSVVGNEGEKELHQHLVSNSPLNSSTKLYLPSHSIISFPPLLYLWSLWAPPSGRACLPSLLLLSAAIIHSSPTNQFVPASFKTSAIIPRMKKAAFEARE